jgi:hypothetical protein
MKNKQTFQCFTTNFNEKGKTIGKTPKTISIELDNIDQIIEAGYLSVRLDDNSKERAR